MDLSFMFLPFLHLNILILAPHTGVSVSYTHLDVYKRQVEMVKLVADTSGQKLFSLYLILIHILAHEASLYIIRAGHLSGFSR